MYSTCLSNISMSISNMQWYSLLHRTICLEGNETRSQSIHRYYIQGELVKAKQINSLIGFKTSSNGKVQPRDSIQILESYIQRTRNFSSLLELKFLISSPSLWYLRVHIQHMQVARYSIYRKYVHPVQAFGHLQILY